MTIGRNGNRSQIRTQKLAKARKVSQSRQILLESLESRQLMTVGPQLIAVQSNEGSVVSEGQVLNVSPRELVFRFDDSTSIDPATLGGIQITRSGGDSAFDRAYVSDDLGTNGLVQLDFAAAVAGQPGNGTRVTFTSVSQNTSGVPLLTVGTKSVNIQLNTLTGFKTTAQNILTAFENSPLARSIVQVRILRGSPTTIVSDTVPAGQTLTLTGANTAKVSSSLNSGSNIQVDFTAAQPGVAGLSTRVVITSRNFGGPGLPNVSVIGQTINVQVNSNVNNATTLGEFVAAINSNTAAAQYVTARISSGNEATRIGTTVANNTTLTLAGLNDVIIQPGYVGLGDTRNEVIVRFAEPLPDDIYRIDILGGGVAALKNTSGQAYNGGIDTSRNFELDLGALVQSVVPQPIVRSIAGTATQLANEIHVYFNDDNLNVADAQNPAFYQLRYLAGSVDSNDDLIVYPRTATYDATTDRVVLRFARNLDQFASAANRSVDALRLRVGSRVDADKFAALPVNDFVAVPQNVPINVASLGSTDPGDRFASAFDLRSAWNLSTTSPSSVVLNSEIRNLTPFQLDFPGADSEPGNRQNRYQQHVIGRDSAGIEVIEYNFQGFLGLSGGSNQLNAITEGQKQLVRNILDLYENYLGVRFVETASRGATIAVGDMRAIDPNVVNGPGGQALITGALLSNGQAAMIIDIQDSNTATDNQFGTELFRTFARGIGNLLGLGSADEVPGLTVQSNIPPVNPGVDTELVYPGNADIVYGQNVHRPESKDIDLYRFSVPAAGQIRIEISAERLQDSSLLDSALRLYRLDGTSWIEVAANDNYFSEDSQIRLDLVAGEYIVGVSAKGNESYNPNIEDSGLGGRSEGQYQLRIDFRPPQSSSMRDSTGIAVDGDSDGRPGGFFDFWFVPSSANNTIFVDKNAPVPGVNTQPDRGDGTLGNPFNKISLALNPATYPVSGTVSANQIFRSQTGEVYRVLRNAALSAGATEAIRISADLASGLITKVTVVRILGNGGADGNIATASDNYAYEVGFNRLGQTQADGATFDVPKNLTVMIDAGAIVKLNRARIGVGSTTVSVDRSGGSLQALGIPRFIDSTGLVIADLTGSPVSGNVYFTSLNDSSVGIGSNRDTNKPTPAPGDWGGIDIRNQVDSAQSGVAGSSRINKESAGLFLNSIIHADLRFGGGSVVLDGVSQVITPVHMIDSRPTIANSLVSRSADAAMSATPNSFLESNFQDPQSQRTSPFISDGERVGPDIHGNRLINNSVNGLFVKSRTSAASTVEVLVVPGRFDDTDIVHVISENLQIQGATGGHIAQTASPISTTVVSTSSVVQGLTNGISSGLYRYRFTFVENQGTGIESPASAATNTITVTTTANASDGQILLTGLPTLQPTQQLKIYRTQLVNGVEQEYRLVGFITSTQSTFTDTTASLGAAISTVPSSVTAPPVSPVVTATNVPGLINALATGTYRYQISYLNADGSESSGLVIPTDAIVVTASGAASGQVVLSNLPVDSSGAAATRRLRIYRATVSPITSLPSAYALVGDVGAGVRSFTDVNSRITLAPPNSPSNSSPRPIAPLTVVFSPSSVAGTGGLAAGTYTYSLAFANSDGTEGVRVQATPATILAVANNAISLTNLPAIAAGSTLRIYRSSATSGNVPTLVGVIASGVTSFVDSDAPLILSPVIAPNQSITPPAASVVLTPQIAPDVNGAPSLTNGLSSGVYAYRLTVVNTLTQIESNFIDIPSTATVATTAGIANGTVTVSNLPALTANQSYRVYRANVINGTAASYYLVASLPFTVTSFVDSQATPGAILVDVPGRLTGRLNGSLTIDPGTVLKLQSSRIEVQGGGQLLAEGTDGAPIIMTSINDVRYGTGGTFDTANRRGTVVPVAGNFGGIFIGQASTGSFDYVRLAYGGGTTRIDGDFASFNAIEGHQADLRITHSILENNASGVESATPTNRTGRGTNFEGTIFVRGSQPVIVDNRILNNAASAINIDVNSLNSQYVLDAGRQSGSVSKTNSRIDNQGPLIVGNSLANNGTNGMVVRGQTLTTESVWDDTDIVHVVRNEIISSNLYTYGGLRLKSNSAASLVVKFGGDSTVTKGLTATGRNLDIADRIGGSVQIVGVPNFPVILTTLDDDSVGAGFTPVGIPVTDTDNNGAFNDAIALLPTIGEVNRGLTIDNDVAANVPGHFEYTPEAGGGRVSSGITAQGTNALLTNANVIFAFSNFVDVGGDGNAISLAATTITLQPTLVSPDLVASEGSFVGNNGAIVNWRVESSFANGEAKLINTVSFSSTTQLGQIRFVNYLDEDVQAPGDDFLFTTGTPGEEDFRAFTIDGGERIGFSHGGIYRPGPGLVNATYTGWAADQYPTLTGLITGVGTTYTPAGNINQLVLPQFTDASVGTAYGPADVTTAFAWDVNPTSTSSTITTFLELIPREVQTSITPGGWRGLLFETGANDRNVALVTEREASQSGAQSRNEVPTLGSATAVNNLPSSSQFLGTIARQISGGDENARLGFEVHGAINRPSDLDVYSFNAVGGTEVWFDIDKTSNGLDTVVELIDASGNVLVMSDDSATEESAGALTFVGIDPQTLSPYLANPLRKSSTVTFPSDSLGKPKDLYSTNPKDAGFRVVLPGSTTQSSLFHVRIRSSNSNASNGIASTTNTNIAGRSQGAYQLQIRLSEAQEFPGASVNFADIRYATTGIDLAGVPRHSPLLGEAAELVDTTAAPVNNTFATAQELGNLLQTDRATISLAGSLSSSSDVDWYTFTIGYQALQTELRQYFSTVFDVDYADGIGRPDTSLYLFDENGSLLTFGLNSNILDDRAGPLRGADNTDLSRGSSGTLDPFLGPVELAASSTATDGTIASGRYYLAITNQGLIPSQILAITNPANGNPLIRMQPSNNTQWIVEDRVDTKGGSTAKPPVVQDFLPTATAAVPFNLADVALYVSSEAGQATNLSIVNPMTGLSQGVGRIAQNVNDIAFRFNGDLRGFNVLDGTGAGDADALIQYININDSTAVGTNVGPLGIQTQRYNIFSQNAGQLQDLAPADVGIEFQAIAFGDLGVEVGIGVGNRTMLSPAQEGIQSGRNVADRGTNVVYRFNPNTGEAIGTSTFNQAVAQGPDIILGNGTDIDELGYIDTNPTAGTPVRTVSFVNATFVDNSAVPPRTTAGMQDGDRFVIQLATGQLVTFEFDSGPEISLRLNPLTGPFLQDRDQFTVDGQVFEIQTDNTPVSLGARPVVYSTSMTNADFAAALQTAANLSGPQFTTTTPLGITIGQAGNRINFLGSRQIAPIAGTSIAQVVQLTNPGGVTQVGVNSNRIPFLAQDTASTLAANAASIINSRAFIGVTATAVNSQVNITSATFVSTIGGVTLPQVAPGGLIRGLAILKSNGSMFAISETGGLFSVNNTLAANPGNIGTFIRRLDVPSNVQFTGLTAGPSNLQNGAYENLLFATASNGNIYAFNTAGELQPIFAFGATSVNTGIAGLNGLAFSNLDFNLWNPTFRRSGDVGHGNPGTPDGIVPAGNPTNPNAANFSWHFGFEGINPLQGTINPSASLNAVTNPAGVPRFEAGNVLNTYNFPGGALGVLESQSIPLSNIVAADNPYLYFNYYSTTESVRFSNRDIVRVRAIGDNGVWREIANDDIDEVGQVLFDNTATQTGWKQARISLAQFAGNENVRFRFEFSTGGGMGLDQGAELRVVSGNNLRDGQVFTVGTSSFEIEMGPTITVPAGQTIVDGSSFTISNNTFVFWNQISARPTTGIVVPYSIGQTASEIAVTIGNLLSSLALPGRVILPPVSSPESPSFQATIATAIDTGVNGNQSSRVEGSGRIGPIPAAGAVSVLDNGDVDFFSARLAAGATARFTLSPQSTTPPTPFTPLVRVFNATGVEITTNRIGTDTTFIVPSDGIYYFGVSTSVNNGYSPLAQSGAIPNGEGGSYRFILDVANNIVATVIGNRVQLSGGAAVALPAGSRLQLNGSTGVAAGNIPVFVNSLFTPAEVATAVQTALVGSIGQNSSYDIFPTRGEFVTLPGVRQGGVTAGPFSVNYPTENITVNRLFGNDFEGVFLDDFVVGISERGEGVRGSSTNTDFVANPNAVPNSINQGPYQLEIRGGQEYGTPTQIGLNYTPIDPSDLLTSSVNTRLSTGTTLQLPNALSIVTGDTITVSDGVNRVDFVFVDRASNFAVQAGQVAITYSNGIIDASTGVFASEKDATIAARFRDVLNSSAVQNRLKVTAISLNGATSGLAGRELALSANAVVTVTNAATGNPRPPVATVTAYSGRGDSNTPRDQGQIIVENSKISDSAQFGILMRPDARDPLSGGNNPNPGAVRNTVVLNNERLAPGAAIINNELVSNRAGGIQIVGDNATNTTVPSVVPFARIVNNTIVGGTITTTTVPGPQVYNDYLFVNGSISFVDTVVSYLPLFSNGVAAAPGVSDPLAVLGTPNYTGLLAEPGTGQGALSLGRGGRVTVQFVDNILTGSNDARPDLFVNEVGDSERALVEVSTDGVTYTSVGAISGTARTIDLDFYGFNRDSRLRFVRVTDDFLNGAIAGETVGADIDAIGALSSIPATVYSPLGTGISIGASASPTLLNNIIVNSATGLNIDPASSLNANILPSVAAPVVGGMLFQRNTSNLGGTATVGQFALQPNNFVELFQDASKRLFYPKEFSVGIDSTIDSLLDRAGLIAVKQPLGLDLSPILAPTFDLNGLLRVDDPTVDTPAGTGQNVFKDRGAQDRSDIVGPAAIITVPVDNSSTGSDVSNALGVVQIQNRSIPYFEVRLIDGVDLGSSANGTGVDPSTVNSSSVTVTRDGQELIEGVDYRFGYDATSGVIRLTPVAGVWTSDAEYKIRFVSSGQNSIPLNSISNLADATTYVILDANGDYHTFELDLGIRFNVPINADGLTHDLTDGTQFILSDGVNTITYEFDTDAIVATNSIPIAIVSSDTPALVIPKIIAAIQGSGLNASVNAISQSSVQVLGSGVTLVSNVTRLTTTGTNGTVSTAIPVVLNAGLLLDADLVATAVSNAIIAAGLPGVTVSQSGRNVLLVGAQAVYGSGATVVGEIRDKAGNPLRANGDSGETTLTIILTEGFDYGDAPDPTYASLKANNGPRHRVLEGYYLGAGVTADGDAVANDGDSLDDGVVFPANVTKGYTTTLTVTASGISADQPGILSAWIDYDKDGLFEETERITAAGGKQLVNGSLNTVQFVVPGEVEPGPLNARFRYSSVGALSPLGDAIDGEVEDYVFLVSNNAFQNPTNRFDVNNDSFVSPIDVLQVINYLNRNPGQGSNQLPLVPTTPVPPYVDVNGDSFVTPLDVLLVINDLTTRARARAATGEGESTDLGNTWVAATPSTPIVPGVSSGNAVPAISVTTVPSNAEIANSSASTSSPFVGSQTTPLASLDSVWAASGSAANDWLEDDDEWDEVVDDESTDTSTVDSLFARLQGFGS